MITTVLNALLTPASIATPPPNAPALVQEYNWETQMGKSPLNQPTNLGTFKGTSSFVGTNLVIDDGNFD